MIRFRSAGNLGALAYLAVVTMPLSLSAAAAAGQPAPVVDSEAARAIDAHFAEFDGQRPGYAVGVISAGELRYAKGFGSADLDHGVSIGPRTVFNVASLSKQFTAAALAILIQRQSVGLEDPVQKHIPELPDRFAGVALQHLVYMTSGLPEYYNLPRPGGRSWDSDYFTVQDAIAAVLSQPELEFLPGTKWAYSNTNYQLIAEVVERVGGVRFSEFVESEIFKPLGMEDSLVDDDLGRVIPGRATGYNREGEGFRQEIRRSPHYGGSGVFTTLEDLAKWDSQFRDHRLGGIELTELLLQTRAFEHEKANDAFGLVWGEYAGRRTIWYEGGDLGFSSYMARFPDDDLTVIVLSNLGTGRALHHAHAVMEILFAEKHGAGTTERESAPIWDLASYLSDAQEEINDQVYALLPFDDCDAETECDSRAYALVHGKTADSLSEIRALEHGGGRERQAAAGRAYLFLARQALSVGNREVAAEHALHVYLSGTPHRLRLEALRVSCNSASPEESSRWIGKPRDETLK